MPNPLRAQLDECRSAILAAILDSLRERTAYINAIERTGRGELPVTGIALELFPWNGGFGLSLRLNEDYPMGDYRYESGDWAHSCFTEGCEAPSIEVAGAVVAQFYGQAESLSVPKTEMAHLAFLAGAEALLHPAVAKFLKGLKIKAPEFKDTFISSPFQYIVIDEDQTVKSNYCDLVIANRVADRLLGTGA